MRYIIFAIAFTAVTFLLTGCATMLRGYEDTVTIRNPRDSLRVFTLSGEELRVYRTGKRYLTSHGITSGAEIRLRSDREHSLLIRTPDGEKRVTVYPELGFGWVMLDLVCGVVPSFYDAYTGCWNTFRDIDAALP